MKERKLFDFTIVWILIYISTKHSNDFLTEIKFVRHEILSWMQDFPLFCNFPIFYVFKKSGEKLSNDCRGENPQFSSKVHEKKNVIFAKRSENIYIHQRIAKKHDFCQNFLKNAIFLKRSQKTRFWSIKFEKNAIFVKRS